MSVRIFTYEPEVHNIGAHVGSQTTICKCLPSLGAQGKRPDEKVSLFIFKGQPGEKPEPDLLKANDWLDNNRTLEHEKSYDFKNPLDDVAWEWYDDIVVPADWNAIQALFHRYFSMQGRSIKYLHERWRYFMFDPHTDDIEVFISNVKQNICKHNHNYITISNTIKASISTDICDTLYPVQELDVTVAMVKDILPRSLNLEQPQGHSIYYFLYFKT